MAPTRIDQTFGLTTYDADPPDFVIPGDLSGLDDDALAALHTDAVGHFDTIFNGGQSLSDADVASLSVLTEGIEAVLAESGTRQAAAAQRSAAATELASRVHTEERTTESVTDEETPDPPEDPAAVEGEDAPVEEPVAVVAAASPRREIRVNVAALRNGRPAPAPATGPPSKASDVMFSTGDGSGFPAGQGVDWRQVGEIVDRRLSSFNPAAFASAQAAGNHISQTAGVAVIRRDFPAELTLTSNDPDHVDAVIQHAIDEARLPGGSLVASGGWCAPSEILYDLLELESRDGLFSGPEIHVARGGIRWTTGPDWTDIYAGTGFSYTEANDIAGNYAVGAAPFHEGTGSAGSKPCYTVTCPSFSEARLALAGLCVNAGLLQQRGYPEVIARTVRGALIAHDHKMSYRKINAMVTGSDAVTMTTGTVGTVAPLLTAIEQQTEHYRYIRRMARNATLEAVFPFWVRATIRSDLALRQGVMELDVTDAQIDSWFRSRGISPQYVYDWQPLTGAAGAFTQWPATVQFLLYAAGTWVFGASDIITIDTLYDSTLLGNNNFTALFTEEGWLAAKRGFDSRVITVPICSTGNTGGPVLIGCNGGTGAALETTAPVAGTLASSSITTTGFTLTVTGASDAGIGLANLPYRFSIDGGATWTPWQASNVDVVTGLVTGTLYPTRHEVRDLNGNLSAGNALNVTTS
jgi:hypothetical protein